MTQPPHQSESSDDRPEDAKIQELLTTGRELTADEQRTLRTLAAAGWSQVTRILARNADRAYAMASPQEFGECVFAHMSVEDRAAIILAEVYHCPTCGRLLKDRNNPVASSILLERRRLRSKWAEVEAAGPDERSQALEAFRAALGYQP